MAGFPRAVLFDLDRVLIDSRKAWQYSLEEALASTTGRRISAAPLVGEYHQRPWRHVLAVVAGSPEEQEQCEALCIEMMRRSALKKLLVHEGMGMGLDAVRNARIEMGAVSREPHNLALKQAQSTGLDRFLTVLAATPEGEAWDAGGRFAQCLAFLEYSAAECVVVTGETDDATTARAMGFQVLAPGWLPVDERCGVHVESPGALLEQLRGLASP